MNILNQVAESIEPMIKFTCDFPSAHDDGKIPILDVKVWLNSENEALFEFFEKETKSQKVILASSALPNNQKLTILTAEAVRRLRNTSQQLGPEVQTNHLNNFTVKLKDSGYPEEFRAKVISQAK